MRLQPGGPSGVPSIQNSFPTTVLHQTTHLALILQDWLRTLLPPFPTLGKVRLPPVFLPHPTLPSTAYCRHWECLSICLPQPPGCKLGEEGQPSPFCPSPWLDPQGWILQWTEDACALGFVSLSFLFLKKIFMYLFTWLRWV